MKYKKIFIALQSVKFVNSCGIWAETPQKTPLTKTSPRPKTTNAKSDFRHIYKVKTIFIVTKLHATEFRIRLKIDPEKVLFSHKKRIFADKPKQKMTRRELWDTICSAAAQLYDEREARAVTALVCEERFGLRFVDVIVEPGAPYPDRDDLPQILEQLRQGRPAQYITGQTLFCGRKFQVREGVLIPRPETEELVLRIVEEQKNRANPTVLDIGTGSGCIAVSLAVLLPQASVTAVDISDRALEIATENAREHRLSVDFRKCDILEQMPEGRFDILVSNPPYVTRSERAQIKQNVLNYEPDEALFVEDSDPLLFYRIIAQRGLHLLNAGGTLYFEINEQFGGSVQELLSGMGYRDVALHNDMFGKPRIIAAWMR